MVSSAFSPISHYLFFLNIFSQPLKIKGYGMSECEATAVGTCGFNTQEVHNYASAGLLAPNMQAKVVGWVTRLHLPPGKTGELWLRGPAIMKGSYI
ncbi:putative AMP-dependent synthetase/ligase, AMP-dependent synthetase-like superfamily [Helianthus annuus]|nr:putative AMP-dependent synthetase/ligase, AMP-dependent synthetase-like superfamily [Helianthus annuus]